jgi:hypothetical protein
MFEMYRVLIGVGLLTSASEATASNWIKVGDGSDRAMYVDSNSIQSNGSRRTAWTKTVYVRGRLNEFKALEYFDCSGLQTALKSAVEYRRDGTLASNTWEDYELRWEPIVPDTLGESTFNAVCHW